MTEKKKGFKITQFGMKLLYKFCPPARPYIKLVDSVDKGLDVAADVARSSRERMVDQIRKNYGKLSIVLILLLATGCQTVKDLRSEGMTVTRWEATQLNVLDAIIGTDNAVDYVMDAEIGK